MRRLGPSAKTVETINVASDLDKIRVEIAGEWQLILVPAIGDTIEIPIQFNGHTTVGTLTAAILTSQQPTCRASLIAASGKRRRAITGPAQQALPRQSPLANDEGDVASVRLVRAGDGRLSVIWRWLSGPHRTTPGDSAVVWGGLTSREDNAVAADVITNNVVTTSKALGDARVEHVVASSPGSPGHILVNAEHEPRARDVANELSSRPTWHVAETNRGFAVFESVVTPARSVHHARSLATTVEIRPRRELPRPDAHWAVSGIDLPTNHAYLLPSVQSAPAPIDAVWTWVDSSDPDWRDSRDKALPGVSLASNSIDGSRFDNRDELRFSLRSAHAYAPWIRHHVIVTAGHLPPWLDPTHPSIRVVRHADIMPAEVLPTFNSHAIEAHLHRIDGISPQFLYFNDDVFLGRAVEAGQFFGPTGQVKVFRSPTPIPHTPIDSEDSGFYASRKNNRKVLERTFGVTLHHGYLHTTHSLRTDVLHEIAERFPHEWHNTAAARFRSPTDLAIASSLHHDIAILTGRGHDGAIRSKYVKAGCQSDVETMINVFLARDRDVFCLNDTADRDLPVETQNRSMAAFMQAYFPVAAPWERS